MRRYFAQQVGSPQQLPPQLEVLDVADATVPRAATRTNSSANRDFFMVLLLGASAPLVLFGFLERVKIVRRVAGVSVPEGHVQEMEWRRLGDLRKVKRRRRGADRGRR